MIRRLRIKNYRNFVDLDVELPRIALLMGANGTGKSSLFDVLDALRKLVIDGRSCVECFPPESSSRILPGLGGSFQLDMKVRSSGLDLCYELEIERSEVGRGGSRVAHEILSDASGRTYFEFEDGVVRLGENGGAAKIPFDPSGSAIAKFTTNESSLELREFRRLISSLACLRVDPAAMEAQSFKPDPSLARDCSNFASWYRHACREDPKAVERLSSDLAEALPGFRELRFLPNRGDAAGLTFLQAQFAQGADARPERAAEVAYPVTLRELSDGQRALVALYSLLNFGPVGGSILCLDEPDNYLSLPEIQPFLFRLLDKMDEHPTAQLLIASHHPDLYNFLAPDHGVVLTRDDSGAVRANRFEAPQDTLLTAAELIARGEVPH